jgi:cyclopropane fatty-acyl-phospholipid synthase-like methyltransferase
MRGPGTRSHQDELLHANQVLADAVAIRPGEHVLDAGCGIGGGGIWLASERGARVFGVTLSETQLRIAREAALRAGVVDRVEFRVEDYTRTSLPDESVDVVWAHESACYAPDRRALLEEVRRVLRPGGRIVVADGFLARPPRVGEFWLLEAFERGLVLPPLGSVSELLGSLREFGFSIERAESRLREVTPSCRRLFWRCLVSYPLALIGWSLGRVSSLMLANSHAGIGLYLMVVLGIVEYQLVVAVKRDRATHAPSTLPSPNPRIKL